MPTNPIAATFLDYSANRLRKSQKEITFCLDKLTVEQMSHRGGEHENSIANLLLHLEGNLRQWVLHGVGGQPDVRQRDEEFTRSMETDPIAARAAFDRVIDEACAVLGALDLERLLEVIDPQPTGIYRHPTILAAIYKAVGHLEHHTGQIILLTKQMTATDLDLSMPRKR